MTSMLIAGFLLDRFLRLPIAVETLATWAYTTTHMNQATNPFFITLYCFAIFICTNEKLYSSTFVFASQYYYIYIIYYNLNLTYKTLLFSMLIRVSSINNSLISIVQSTDIFAFMEEIIIFSSFW